MSTTAARHELHARQKAAAAADQRRSRWKRWLGWSAALAAVAGMLITSQTTSATTSTTAPDFTLPTTADTTVTLSALRGRPVLLYFNEGAGCGACIMQMAEIEKHKADLGKINASLKKAS